MFRCWVLSAVTVTWLGCALAGTAETAESGEAMACAETVTSEVYNVDITWPRVTEMPELESRCWMTDAQARQWELEGEVMWVDVRSSAEARKRPLGGALTLPPDDPGGWTFLRDRRVVLVGNGFDRKAVAQVCEKLRQAGFDDVYALAGGVRAWVEAGRFVAGAESVPRNEITPETFLSASAAAGWKVVTLGLDEEAVRRLPVAPAHRLASQPGAVRESLAWQSQIQVERDGVAPSGQIVLIAPDEETTRNHQNELAQYDAPGEVLWLKGGWKAYERYVGQQQKILSNRGRPLTRPCWAG